jgi:hypothetical protein
MVQEDVYFIAFAKCFFNRYRVVPQKEPNAFTNKQYGNRLSGVSQQNVKNVHDSTFLARKYSRSFEED